MTTDTLIAAEPLCLNCVRDEGLCRVHAKSVLPQLAQPHWYRLIGTTLAKTDTPLPEESTAALRAKRRVARRLQRAMSGEFTRSARSTRSTRAASFA